MVDKAEFKVKRLSEALLEELLEIFRVVCVVGIRQSGKSTLVRGLQNPNKKYLSLDDLAQLSFAQSDPIGFIEQNAVPLIIDEVQKAPELVSPIKSKVDLHPDCGQYILTGSTNITLDNRFSDSLVGRMGILNLYPLSQAELADGNGDFIQRLLDNDFVSPTISLSQNELVELLVTGGFPEAITKRNSRARSLWFNNYISLVMSRDIKELFGVRKIEAIHQLFNLFTINCATELNKQKLAQQLQLARETVDEYIAILRKVFFIELLPSFQTNELKRAIKAPKIQIMDTGLICAQRGLTEKRLVENREVLGRVLDNYVGAELLKLISFAQIPNLKLYHYRDEKKREVDYILSNDTDINIGIEVKASMTPNSSMAAHLNYLIARNAIDRGVIIHTGTQQVYLNRNVQAIPVTYLFS